MPNCIFQFFRIKFSSKKAIFLAHYFVLFHIKLLIMFPFSANSRI